MVIFLLFFIPLVVVLGRGESASFPTSVLHFVLLSLPFFSSFPALFPEALQYATSLLQIMCVVGGPGSTDHTVIDIKSSKGGINISIPSRVAYILAAHT
uniref:Putative secreted peptide n=1 Tax=Anopheles braziliensis TaxID=58242 RepID=A0A2M3ZU42_9DIPT